MSTREVADVIAPVNEEGTKATILRWCKAVGDPVRKDEPLLELETDKVTVEISSPASGELVEILKQPDEEVLPGQMLARVRIAAESHSRPRRRRRPQALRARPLSARCRGAMSAPQC